MNKSVEGIFKDGKIHLLEPAPTQDESRVVVTFISDPGEVNLRDRGIDEAQAADLRARLKSMNDDWNRPEMDVYDEPLNAATSYSCCFPTPTFGPPSAAPRWLFNPTI